MLYLGKKKEAVMTNFLKSGKVQSFTMQIDKTHAQYDATNEVVPAGAIYKDKSGNAIGITYNDSYVAGGAQPVAVIVEGHILNDRLPVPATEKEIKQLNSRGIRFYDGNQAPIIPAAGSSGGE